ncbi:hypothetical protein KCU67_g279, partial [Aureobasidium melanogenum]
MMASDKDDITPSGDSPSRLRTMNSSAAEQKDSKESSDFRDAASAMDEKDIIGGTEVIQIRDVDDSTALDIENDVEAVMDKVITLSIEECRKLLEELLEDHKYDYNFTRSQKEKLRNLLGGPAQDQSVGEWEIILKKETAINIFYSP